jgi:hypothetical protein
MKRKYFNYSPEAIISANLDLQTTQRELKFKFGFNSLKVEDICTPKVINKYMSWTEEKRNDFIAKIGGKANFKKTKGFVESIIGVSNENR